MNEADWQGRVVDTAQRHGWLVAHFRPARVKGDDEDEWRTPVAYDGKGFPDLVIARAGVVLLAELKSDTGRVTADQQRWLDAAGGLVWRPRDWPEVLRILSTPRWKLVRR